MTTPFDFYKNPKNPKKPNPGFESDLFEDFSYGWSKETTYDRPRQRAIDLINHAASIGDTESQQALLQCAIMFMIAGLESFFQFAANHRELRVPIFQKFKVYEKVAKQYPEYEKIDHQDRAALRRLFLVRHAIVHNDGRITKQLRANLNGSVNKSEKIHLSAESILPVIDAADKFVESVCRCDDTLRSLVI